MKVVSNPIDNHFYDTDSTGYGYERIRLPEDKDKGLLEVTLEINRGFIEGVYRGGKSYLELPQSKSQKLAAFAEHGYNSNGEYISYSFTVSANRSGTVSWYGYTSGQFVSFAVCEPQPLEEAAAEVLQLNKSATKL